MVERWTRKLRSGVEEYSLTAVPRRVQLGSRARLERRERRRNGLVVTEVGIGIRGLPGAFHGLRIVHLTDIHHGFYVPLQAVLDVVELANELEPDVVALTGDFVTYSKSYIGPMAAALGELRARHGVYAVLGNHDFRVDAEGVTRALRQQKIEVLRNRHTALHAGGEKFYVAGVDDTGYGADLTRAMRGLPALAPTVLLSHNPSIVRRASRYWVSLVLSGHTHGGQIKLPLVGSIYGKKSERARFTAGWDRIGHTQIYVSRGIGTIVVPWRYRCPAEMPHIHLLQQAAVAVPAKKAGR